MATTEKSIKINLVICPYCGCFVEENDIEKPVDYCHHRFTATIERVNPDPAMKFLDKSIKKTFKGVA